LKLKAMDPIWLKVAAISAGAIRGSKTATRAVMVPTLRVVEEFLRLCKLGVAHDVGEIRSDMLTKSRAGATIDHAEARKRMAEAVEAENRAEYARQREELELRSRAATVAKLEAEARVAGAIAQVAEVQVTALEAEVSSTDPKAVDEAAERLKKSLRRLNSKGGELIVEGEILKDIKKELEDSTED
jgi:hypothetical protein